MVRQGKNEDLVLARIPYPEADWSTIERFALTFDAYEHWGSFDQCAEIANARRRDSLTEARTCLFFEQRRFRHFDSPPSGEDLAYLRELLKDIRARVEAGRLE